MALNPNAGDRPAGPILSSLKRRRKYRLRRLNYDNLHTLKASGGGEGDAAALEELRRQVTVLEADKREAADKLLRQQAEMDNQRRRFQKEKEEMRKFAGEDLMRGLMPALEHFSLALASLEKATDPSAVRQGVEMIHREILGVLQSAGLEEIPAMGAQFDPNLHDAAATDNVPDQPNGVVTELLRPGWALRGKVLRPALVKVNKVEEPVG